MTGDQSTGAPGIVRLAVRLWWLAIAAGVFETVLVVVAYAAGNGPGLSRRAMLTQVVVRSVVFVVAAVAALELERGSRVAGVLLTVGLGVLGLASLLVGPVEWLLSGADLDAIPTTGIEVPFLVSRVVHVAAVLAALVCMYRPEARAWWWRRAG